MNLGLFRNLEKRESSNKEVNNFLEELKNFINKFKESKEDNININENEIKLRENRKEGHLYFVTEDRNNEVYLWDFTDKPKHEFKEIIKSNKLLKVAKEGAMLIYEKGEYKLYSPNGYEMLENAEKNK